MIKRLLLAPSVGLVVGLSGCHHPSVTAVSLNQTCGPECDSFWGVVHHCLKDKEEGIPFYLPKPLLIIAKNFRSVEQTQVGLTGGAPIPNYFDDQSKYADLNSRSQFIGPDTPAGQPKIAPNPSKDGEKLEGTAKSATAAKATIYPDKGAPVNLATPPGDTLKPDVFYTYHIVFVPDLTQKYGLKVKGGVGEIRAAMNLVNGWQFTGLGPFYMKDSSTAQNTLASGIAANLALNGVGNVVKSLTDLSSAAAGASKPSKPAEAPQEPPAGMMRALKDIEKLGLRKCDFSKYAEIHVYEAFLTPEGTMEWRLIADHTMAREVIGALVDEPVGAQDAAGAQAPEFPAVPGPPEQPNARRTSPPTLLPPHGAASRPLQTGSRGPRPPFQPAGASGLMPRSFPLAPGMAAARPPASAAPAARGPGQPKLASGIRLAGQTSTTPATGTKAPSAQPPAAGPGKKPDRAVPAEFRP